MDRSNTIRLISTTYTVDAIGQRVPTEVPRQVFCNLGSVSATEYFEAGRNGLNAEYRATVLREEYHGERLAELNGQRYGIYRTYIGTGDELELYLERKAGV